MQPSSPQTRVDLSSLSLGEGAQILLRHALNRCAPGETVEVSGSHPDLIYHLPAWCRAKGHRWVDAKPDDADGVVGRIELSQLRMCRRFNASQAGLADARAPDAIANVAPARWGLAARGAWVEAGMPDFHFGIRQKDEIWTDQAERFYLQAVSNQWDPCTEIEWNKAPALPAEVEDAVVQVMTYLVENETVALLVPARFLAQVHPHFREILQLLAIQVADEARHIEVFTRRATLFRDELGLSTVGGQMSLKTLIDEPDFALAMFLLSVLGEGTFLSLLWFLDRNAPDPVTQKVVRLAAQDEARHVAFGMAHLTRHIEKDSTLLERLENAVYARHDALQNTSGLNAEVFEALVVIAAGSFEADAIARGYRAVAELQEEMNESRIKRLKKIGFDSERAASLAELHTRNFM